MKLDGLGFTSVNQCFEKAWATFGLVHKSKKYERATF